jgi:hypothetical protein
MTWGTVADSTGLVRIANSATSNTTATNTPVMTRTLVRSQATKIRSRVDQFESFESCVSGIPRN